ncbi:MAG: hypothetical protein NTV86_00650 [Planctomycetota bacterium]|nr:hypothetical protein [Planctomycetota bacterium]
MTETKDTPTPPATPSRRPLAGWLLTVAGAVGVITGAVPLAINAVRVVTGCGLRGGLAGHGVEALGLTVEWGLLSSAMGVCLGVLLLAAGAGWRNARPWAAPISWAYVLFGLGVNASDMTIFLFRSTPGPTRTLMLLSDGVAFLIPLALALWLATRSRER